MRKKKLLTSQQLFSLLIINCKLLINSLFVQNLAQFQ